MNKKKYTIYVLDKNNRFFKDCIHEYLQTVKSFEDHFTGRELRKIKSIKKRYNSKANKKKLKPHKYHL